MKISLEGFTSKCEQEEKKSVTLKIGVLKLSSLENRKEKEKNKENEQSLRKL